MRKPTRRQLLNAVGAFAGGYVAGSVGKADAASTAPGQPAAQAWTYHPLDSKVAAAKAYDGYKQGACMYAVTAGVIEPLAEAHGEPYRSFPLPMMRYGHGGVGGWGGTCGAVNGASAMIGLFVSDAAHRDAMIRQLSQWYEGAELPQFLPADATGPSMATSCAGSVLCHASVSKWCAAAKQPIDHPLRKERCRRLSADLAGKVIQLLNEYFATHQAPVFKPSAVIAGCIECHGAGGEQSNISGTMSCVSCHDIDPDDHP
jgi:hypothetical protein